MQEFFALEYLKILWWSSQDFSIYRFSIGLIFSRNQAKMLNNWKTMEYLAIQTEITKKLEHGKFAVWIRTTLVFFYTD